MRVPTLQAILDFEVTTRARWAVADLARAYLDGGARCLQLRAKGLASGALLTLTERLVRVAAPYAAIVLVNDRPDVARIGGAGGVHVGQEDLPPAAARALVGPDAWVGVSTHSVVQVEAAVREPVTYVAVGPVFGTSTKDTGYDAVGLDLVRAAARVSMEAAASGKRPLPIVAIGGITLASAPSVLGAGASGVAVISDLLADGDPVGRVRRYVEALAGFGG